MARARLTVPLFVVALACTPLPAAAQMETFVQAARAMADAAAQPATARATAVREAAQRMTAALAEWDRIIEALAARVDRGSGDGARGQQPFQLHVELGVAYRTRGRLTDALREFDAAASIKPSSSDLQVLRALTLEALGRTEDAARVFRTAWNLDPPNPVKAYYALQRRGVTTAADRERARAVLVETYGRLRTDATRPASLPFVTLGALPDAWSAAPIVGDDLTAPGFALLAAGKYREAVAALARPDPARTGGIAPSPLSEFLRAQAAEADSRVTEARRGYTASLAGALAGRSIIYVAIGRLAQVEADAPGALDAFTHAVQLNPNDPLPHQELANAYAAEGRGDEAFVELVAGLLINPANAQLHAAIGQLHLDSGRFAEAVPALSRALELNPDRYEVRYALATAFARLGRTADAARQLDLFDRVRREMLERRRREIQADVEREDAIRRGLSSPGDSR